MKKRDEMKGRVREEPSAWRYASRDVHVSPGANVEKYCPREGVRREA